MLVRMQQPRQSNHEVPDMLDFAAGEPIAKEKYTCAGWMDAWNQRTNETPPHEATSALHHVQQGECNTGGPLNSMALNDLP